jgi:hypothetical protein
MRPYAIAILFLIAGSVCAQTSILSNPVTLSATEVPLAFSAFVERIEKQMGVRFFFHPDWISYLTVDRAYTNMPLREVLNQVLDGSGITYTQFHDYGIILIKDPTAAIERDQLLSRAIAERKRIQQVRIGNPADFRPDRPVTLTGVVTDEKSTSPVRNATILVVNGNEGVTTNDRGYYELTLPSGEYVLSYRHANFAEKIIDLQLFTGGRLDVELEEVAIMLEEVVVADQAIAEKNIGEQTLRIREMKRLPTFLGEVDLIKQVQTQAGVTTVGEVASGFNVRGGGVDQNLVLYDGVPVFNTAHAFGFFSAFNADALSQVSFYKSAIPAEFGGRASSVLNVSSKEGQTDRWSGGGGIGLISTNLHLNGPIKKDASSVMASFRTTYSDWMLDLVNSDYLSLQNSSVSFYDGSLKLTHKFSDRSRITLSAYASSDRMRLTNDTLFQWNNLATSIRWDKTGGENLYYSVTLGLGSYSYQVEEPDPFQAFNLSYRIVYPTLKVDFNHTRNRPKAFGLQAILYNFNPGTLEPASAESTIEHKDIDDEHAMEVALYYNESFRWGERIFLDAGLRYALYARLGPGKVYGYTPDQPLEPQHIIDSVFYESGEIMQAYSGPEPRLSLRYALNKNSSIKVGYNRVHQFIHLVSNTAAITPVDIWQSSNQFFRPQLADQVAAGYFRNLKENTYEVFGEVFYKHINNILEFKDGAQLILNDKLETDLLSGVSKAYGVELSANKLRGRLQGGINYTWSRSLRQVDGTFDSEQINRGTWYPSNFDQPHIVNVVWRYGISRRHFFSGTFNYHAGRPISLPAQIYTIDGTVVSNFPDRNTYRLPDYHRLDIALIIEGNHKRKKLWDGTWIASIYNVYSRKNAYSVFFEPDSNGILRPYQLSVIGAIIPTITYSFKF